MIIRQKRIVELLNGKRFMTVNELSKILHYSPSTIRRDLAELERKDMIQRVAGGALLIQSQYVEAPQSFKETIHRTEKNYIGNLAMEFIENYNSLFLDGSSTSLILSNNLERFQHLNIITPNLKTAVNSNISKTNTVHMLGGTVSDVICNGIQTNRYAENFLTDLAFVSCRGLTIGAGASDRLENEASLKQVFRNQSKKVILLADHHKFGVKNLFQILPLSKIDAIVTDKKPSDDFIESFNQNNVELFY